MIEIPGTGINMAASRRKAVFVLDKKTMQLKDLNHHIDGLRRNLIAEKRRMQKMIIAMGVNSDDHALFMLTQVKASISWMETMIATFEKGIDKLLAQTTDYTEFIR